MQFKSEILNENDFEGAKQETGSPNGNSSMSPKQSEEFFPDSWCFKKDNEFVFSIGSQIIRKVSTEFLPIAGGHARLINFDAEFAGLYFPVDHQHKKIKGCHIRVDQAIPKLKRDYSAIPPYHVTLQLGDQSIHLCFTEAGAKVGNAWSLCPTELGKTGFDVAQKVASIGLQFAQQIEIRRAQEVAAPQVSEPAIELNYVTVYAPAPQTYYVYPQTSYYPQVSYPYGPQVSYPYGPQVSYPYGPQMSYPYGPQMSYPIYAPQANWTTAQINNPMTQGRHVQQVNDNIPAQQVSLRASINQTFLPPPRSNQGCPQNNNNNNNNNNNIKSILKRPSSN